MIKKQVILVDEYDAPRGTMELLEAHKKEELHRAFSIFVFNSKGELLLQKRALDKYHSGGLWTNTCCSHPLPDESLKDSVHRRLYEEMGFTCDLENVFHFIYKAKLDKGLTEHELDHVFIGYSNEKPVINQQEVADWNYMPVHEIQQNIMINPSQYTIWFRIIFSKVLEYIRQEGG